MLVQNNPLVHNSTWICLDSSDQSRELCENPEKYHLKPACSEVQCSGHRRGQCVTNKQMCDEELDCMDRSDESNCTQQLEIIDSALHDLNLCVDKVKTLLISKRQLKNEYQIRADYYKTFSW